MKNILEGYRILDCSIAMAGPFAGQRLGDLGADVIKVEPVAGEWQRHVSAGGARGNQVNVSFLSLNRNKRSLAVDLKSEAGKNLLYRMVEQSDVFLQNYRPGVAARLGVDYETLSRINPGLVYVSISGYGEDGPYKLRPGQDLLLQGMSGAMMSAGRAGDPPSPAGQYLVDAVTASTAFEGALAALLHRERTGEGQLVQVNMLDAIIALQMQELSVFSVGGKPQERSQEPHAHVYIRAPYGVFETADGYITLAFPSMKSLSTALEAPELANLDDEKDTFERRDEIYAITRKKLVERTSAQWLDIFDKLGIWAGPVYGYEDVINDPQVEFNGTFVEYDHPTEGHIKTPGFPIKFSRTPSKVVRGAPLAGQHTREILEAMGLTTQEIDHLREGKIIGETRLPDTGTAARTSHAPEAQMAASETSGDRS
ncbi:Crotonobetainyl-CoA:carnitine CoA-transferase CaiB-like acyl-CoA transferase OS=Castellaniella defragrans OX=75697 GN=HNR28_001164 PE=3 SV=1 [Castellaniella defragrans]